MILITGGTGSLGSHLIPLLTGRGYRLRLLVRDPAKAADLEGELVETVAGDVRDPAALQRATVGVGTVISAMSAFGRGAGTAETVDWKGNVSLIHAAEAAGVEHYILLSARGASRDDPMELFRMKYRAEEELLASRLAWTIIRPSANFETWAMIVCEPLLKTGKTMIFGRGHNPINFVSVRDVAHFVELAVTDPALRGRLIEVGGPQNLTVNQLLEIFQTQTGASGAKRHVPRAAMWLASRALRPINPMRAQQVRAAYLMDTLDMTFDPAETMRGYPTFVPTPFAEVLAHDFPQGARRTT